MVRKINLRKNKRKTKNKKDKLNHKLKIFKLNRKLIEKWVYKSNRIKT